MTTVTKCFLILLLAAFAPASVAQGAVPAWTSPNHYRILLTVDPRGVVRSNSPATVDLNLAQALVDQGGNGTFDARTVEVIAYDANGAPVVFDASRTGYERYLLPCQVQPYFGISKITLHFVLPSAVPMDIGMQYAVYFDTVQSGLAQPQRYSGLVGDGDWFREGYKRREINGSHFDHFCDFDGDGDLDLFKAGVEAYVYCYENVGGNRFEDRGWMTSGGSTFLLPHATGSNRSWMTAAFHDWDGDGDQDFFPSFGDGPDIGTFVFYRNTTSENGGRLTFTRVGPMRTVSGGYLAGGAQAGGWFPSITFVRDWDGNGDGRFDVLVGSNNHCYLYRNLGPDGAGGLLLADAVTVKSDGADIVLTNPRFDVADIDADGDTDLIGVSQGSDLAWFQNIDTTTPRRNPTFIRRSFTVDGVPGVALGGHAGVKVADFTGDGLLDLVVGSAWGSGDPNNPAAPRQYGYLYQNLGPASNPLFTKRDAYNGSPYTEGFQICDAIRQNVVRATDWNSDGRLDLIAGDADGFGWYFRNTTNQLFPVFATGEKMYAGGVPINLSSESGYLRHDIADWNNDGLKDLIASSAAGRVYYYRNVGTATTPVLAAGQSILSNGTPIQRGTRAHVMVADWNNDGKKDLVYADQENAGFYYYRNTGTDASPVFGTPEAILFDGKMVTYIRPNLGSFLDWDGDGKKDFIACEFEHTIRYYRNIGTGAAGQVPAFIDTNGSIIVQPFTIMTVSGADARDFNGDGDIDILTGQGHAASGLRFYERDYINDRVNNTVPAVDPGADNIPPAPVVNFTAVAGDRQVALSWTNPSSPDFAGTTIRYRLDQFPVSATDGTLLVEKSGAPGYADALVHTDTLNGATYYYAAFAHDAKPNHAAAATASARYFVIPDLDGDGDVDLIDFATIQRCMTPIGMSMQPGCEPADLLTDGVVNQMDVALFLPCLNGANQPPACQ